MTFRLNILNKENAEYFIYLTLDAKRYLKELVGDKYNSMTIEDILITLKNGDKISIYYSLNELEATLTKIDNDVFHLILV